jgi:hypothetical protein
MCRSKERPYRRMCIEVFVLRKTCKNEHLLYVEWCRETVIFLHKFMYHWQCVVPYDITRKKFSGGELGLCALKECE